MHDVLKKRTPVMADKTNYHGKDDVFWSKIVVDSSDEDAYIPGLSAPGNKRPSRVNARKTKEVRAKVPVKQPVIENMIPDDKLMPLKGKMKKPVMGGVREVRKSLPNKDKYSLGITDDSGMSTTFESFAEQSIRRLQRASLKDLRPEDKQRVANLIKELARVGEEKEKVVKELHGEREQYEHQLMTMVDQQEKILQEREDIQEKLFQCQTLLTEYQAQLLNKQDRLNTSIHDMKEAIGKANPEPPTKTKPHVEPTSTNPQPHSSGTQHRTNPAGIIEVFPPSLSGIRDGTNPAGVIEVCPPVFDLSEMDERSLTPVRHAKIPSPIEEQDHPVDSRKSRSREPARSRESVSKKAANQNKVNEYLTNQHAMDESVSDLLLNPMETVKRPYTSMIDKEIARERSLSRGSRDSDRSRSQSTSPSGGRPKFAYPQNLLSMGPLHEPLASSTQKSMEIRALNHDNDSLWSRSSAKGRERSPATLDNVKSKVAFNGTDEYDVNSEKHSPSTKPPAQMFSDPEYAQYYKKLSPGGRKRELLKQRQALLDEQERLRKVLERQELQLHTRKYEYDKRKELQEQRMEFYKQGGKFPALKLDFETGSEAGSGADDAVEVEKEHGQGFVERGQVSEVKMYSPRRDTEIDDEVQVKSRVSMGTSPMATPPRGNNVSMATSPIPSRASGESDIPGLIDVATSISYRTPLKDTSNRLQGNLPLSCNRQRLSPTHKLSPRTELQSSDRTPGEKTLNVLQLVNSMDDEPRVASRHNRSYDEPRVASRHNRSYEGIENRPDRDYTPNKYITHAKGAHSSPYRQYTSPAQPRTSHGKLLNDAEESLEENKILEDIFFL